MSDEAFRQRPVTVVRRKDRRLDDRDWQDRLLARAPHGQLTLVWEGAPLPNLNIFCYDGERVYLHTAGVGKLRAVLAAGDRPGCFTVSEMGRILPAGTPFDFSTEYASIILYGLASLVTDAAEKRQALDLLMAKYAPQLVAGVDYVVMPDKDVEATSVIRFAITERVGKHNVKPTDYPAYHYPGESFIDAERAAGRFTTSPKELS